MKFCDITLFYCFLDLYTPKEFKLPFWDMAGPHPTNEEMKEIIVQKKIRPQMEPEWDLNKVLHIVN